MNTVDAAVAAFRAAFGVDPTSLAIAPGRVELLGNHTDYNKGLVLAAAIDRHTAVAGRRAEGRRGRTLASDFGLRDDFRLDDLRAGGPGWWSLHVRGLAWRPIGSSSAARRSRLYVRGVAWAVQQAYGLLPAGFEAAFVGGIPLGAGLSSSASLQAAVGLFLVADGRGAEPDDDARMALAHVLRKSENDYVGVPSGLLDQFSVLMGRAGHALALDCRSLEFERVPLGDPAPAIIVCDTRTARELASGMYERRRAESDRVVAHFQGRKDGVKVDSLRDLTLEQLMGDWDTLGEPDRRRARHVLSENERVQQGAAALKSGNVAEFGRLMSASHASSRDDFSNSSAELDAMVEAAEASPGFLGGKLSGAGWAGCTVNLVEMDRAEAFRKAVAEGYERRTGIAPEVHICKAADGASVRALAAGGSTR